MLRLFVALDLTEGMRRRLAQLQAGVPGARWVQPENLHLTLRFIGEVDEGAAADIDTALGRVGLPGFGLVLDSVGQFGSSRRTGQIWAGVEPSESLHLLRDKVDRAIMMAGFPPEQRKFKPHITLARLRGAPPERVRRWLAGNAPFRAGPVAVDRFILYRSHLGGEGSVYEDLAGYPLGPDW